LEVSLVFAVQSVALTTTPSCAENIVRQVRDLLLSMRIAGGSVVPSMATRRRQLPYVVALTGDEQGRDKVFNQTKLRLLPGFILVGRDDLLQQRFDPLRAEDPNASKLDAWLSLSRINWRNEEVADSDTKPSKGQWTHDRKKLGWIVPIPVGYGALTELQEPGSVANARDATTSFRFVESLYSIGQWLSPHRLQSPQQLLWYADSQPDSGLYRCRNDYQTPQMYDFD
jgi:CRISPR-associated protein Csy2